MTSRDTDSGANPHDEYTRLESIPLHSTNLLTVLDEDGIIRYESPAIERVFGFEQDEIIGDPLTEYIHPSDEERVIDAFTEIVSREEYTVAAVDFRHEQADGTYLWVESVGASNPTDDGEYVINTRDISDRKAREEELERMNDRLEEFATMLSHDLRNPLQVAEGHLQLAAETCDSDHLEGIRSAHERMETLIDNMLTRASEGEGVSELEPVDLQSVITDAWRNVETRNGSLAANVNMILRGDRSRLQQLLENLLRNSIEHGGAGVQITVGALDSGFYLEDTGPGIPAERRNEVFTAGYSTGENGMGFGLNIVEQIVEAHEWDIQLRESADSGARFEITNVDIVE